MSDSDLIIALSKGRILKETLPLLKAAGIELLEDPDESRKLIFETTKSNVKVIIIRATDVPTFVESGAADLGVSGKDVLMEYNSSELYEPVDLKIAQCKLMVAAVKGSPAPVGRPKVATKFINIARQYFAGQGKQVDLIKLYGSMELAPLVGMADYIVDIVDTGKTLKENGLEPTELIAPVSSRLIVNKAAMKLKFDSIRPVVDGIAAAVES